ncbi:MAG: 2-polyprenylphenol 6-hydroxylase [Rhizobiaceae bacterium]|nr:2-polyprenylphenol 6-hydroxylase [Hyphomicrobiales bacterium]NRB29145.1 2-polyprenylphenol 6-hydroxylase [Rhizobiaceae bacterium]
MVNLRASFSLLRAIYVMMREGVITALPEEGAPPPVRLAKSVAKLIERRRAKDQAQSENLSKALNRLGPSWVKLGQFLATRPDIVGSSIALDLELLQDSMEPFDTDAAKQMVAATLGEEVDKLFTSFGPAVAAASVAQVHKATIEDANGIHEVAVKVIRPGVRDRFSRDLATFFSAARAMERYIAAAERLQPVAVVEMLAKSAKLEMDLRLEAAGFSEMGENTAEDEGFRVPAVDWERTGRDCITMDWIDGTKLSNVEALAAAGHDLPALANCLNQSFLRHVLRDGFFHADMHPGNLFVDQQSNIVAVDLGISGRLGKLERRYLAEILFGFIVRDYRRVAEVHFEAGYVPDHHDVDSFAQAIRAIGEPIHGQEADKVSMARLLTLLFEVTELFDMKTQAQLLLLQKTMVVVEGVARRLDPKFNMWKSAEPVVAHYVNRLIGPIAKLEEARDGLHAMGRMIQLAPDMAQRAERLSHEIDAMARDGMRLDKPSIEAIGKAEARHSRSGRVALWIIAVCLLALVWKQFV